MKEPEIWIGSRSGYSLVTYSLNVYLSLSFDLDLGGLTMILTSALTSILTSVSSD